MDRNENAVNDVRRKISEVMNKEASKVIVGYGSKTNHHTDGRVEGEVWTDPDGKEWTKKNGSIQSITKLDFTKIPWFCPACGTAMKLKLDNKYWRLRGKCMDCVIKEETEMRRNGTWKEYERAHIKANYIAFLKDRIEELKCYHDSVSSPEIIHADDKNILMIEKWTVDINKIRADLSVDIKNFAEELQKVEGGEYDDII